MTGPLLIAANHSGFSGLDALLLSYQIYQHTARIPRTLTHRLWFSNQWTQSFFPKFGLIQATIENGKDALERNNIVIIFPEGENGNFKPSSQKYVLRKFRKGFIYMAVSSGAPIVPVVILGAEESHINLRQLTLPAWLGNLIVPLPLNLIPLPSKWDVHILKPIYLPFGRDKLEMTDFVEELADEVQETMQQHINRLRRQKRD